MSKKRGAVRDTKYYDYTRVLSYNAFISMVIGGRGIGKTYGFKKLVINDYLRHRREFIYLRRFKTELKGVSSFFTDIAPDFPDYVFRMNGHLAQIKRADAAKEDPWETFGYMVALSNAASKKSIAYPHVHRVGYDECLMGKGMTHYLPGEFNAFLEFLSTVDRNQDRVQCLMLSNNVDIANPYFLEFNITPHIGEIRRYRDGLVVVDFPRGEEYAEYARKSKLGRLTAGSDYERYAIDNEAIAGESAYIGRKTPKAAYVASVIHENISFSIWHDPMQMTWYVSNKVVRDPTVYALTINEATEGSIIIDNTHAIIGMMKTAYRRRLMWFESHQLHAQFQTVLAYMNTK